MLDLPVDMHKLNSWSFNTMEYEEPIHCTMLLIFDAHDFISRYHIDIDILKNLSRAITEGYQSELNIDNIVELFFYWFCD